MHVADAGKRGRSAAGRPRRYTRPPLGWHSPRRILSRVVLPAWLGPSRAKTSPRLDSEADSAQGRSRSVRPQGRRVGLGNVNELGDGRRHGYLIRAICTPCWRIFVNAATMLVDICASVPVMIWFDASGVEALLWVPA